MPRERVAVRARRRRCTGTTRPRAGLCGQVRTSAGRGREAARGRGDSEGLQRVLLVVVDVEDLDELRDGEQVEKLLVRFQDLDDAALLDGPLVAGHQLPDAGAVHEGDLIEIDQEL